MDWEAMMDPDSPEPQFELPEWIAPAPFERLCGLEIVRAGAGEAVLRMPSRVKLAQGGGLPHGGPVTTLADTAVAMAITSRLPAGTPFGTVELATRFYGPVRRGMVEGRAWAEPAEGRGLAGEARVFDEGGAEAASFRARVRVARPGADPGPRPWREANAPSGDGKAHV